MNESCLPMVSIIVPVYNAERFLGYCLNSLLSQTYPSFEVILVNDGSTDHSEEICRNYAGLDTRFHVHSIPNGGVSNARNTGLLLAKGDYLLFVDSDDAIAPDVLESMVAQAQATGKDLIVSDALMVDFEHPQKKHTRFSAGFLRETPCVLSREAFARMKMRLIYFTSLLECPWGKLYRRALWEKLELRFPTQLSLGEDFVINMRYYAACNGAVFLKKIGYYYNGADNDASLTQRYRPDLFNIKMYLNHELEKHLGPWEQLTLDEQNYFSSYVATSGLHCIDRVLRDDGHLTAREQKKLLQQMLADDFFLAHLQRAAYTAPQFLCWKDAVLQKDVAYLLRHSRLRQTSRSLFNRVLCKLMRICGRFLRPRGLAQRVLRVEGYFRTTGVKATFVRYHALCKQRKSFAYQTLCQQKAFGAQLAALQRELQTTHDELLIDHAELLTLRRELQAARQQAADAQLPVEAMGRTAGSAADC